MFWTRLLRELSCNDQMHWSLHLHYNRSTTFVPEKCNFPVQIKNKWKVFLHVRKNRKGMVSCIRLYWIMKYISHSHFLEPKILINEINIHYTNFISYINTFCLEAKNIMDISKNINYYYVRIMNFVKIKYKFVNLRWCL